MQPLLGSPRELLDPALVAEALSLRRATRWRHGLDVLDNLDDPTGQTLRVESRGSSVRWSYRAPDAVVGQAEETTAVRRQASLTVPGLQGVNLYARRLRLWSEVQLLSGAWARFYLGVFLVTNPAALEDDGVRTVQQLRLADKSWRWELDVWREPVLVPVGTKPLTYVRQAMTDRFGETRLAISGRDQALVAPRVFEAGESVAAGLSSLLEADGNEPLTADEFGRPASQPLAVIAGRTSEVTYGPGQAKALPGGSLEPLLASHPNVVRFSGRQGSSLGNVEGNGLRTVRNQSTGPASITARGYEVELRVTVDADDQPALDAVAAADAQRYLAGGGLRWRGQVGLNPRHSDRDVMTLLAPRLGQHGDAWNVTEWSYPLGDFTSAGDSLMTITAERKVTLA